MLLACTYVKAGFSGADVHAIFELITEKHKNKELQKVFNATPELRIKPTELINWIKTNPLNTSPQLA